MNMEFGQSTFGTQIQTKPSTQAINQQSIFANPPKVPFAQPVTQ